MRNLDHPILWAAHRMPNTLVWKQDAPTKLDGSPSFSHWNGHIGLNSTIFRLTHIFYCLICFPLNHISMIFPLYILYPQNKCCLNPDVCLIPRGSQYCDLGMGQKVKIAGSCGCPSPVKYTLLTSHVWITVFPLFPSYFFVKSHVFLTSASPNWDFPHFSLGPSSIAPGLLSTWLRCPSTAADSLRSDLPGESSYQGNQLMGISGN